MHIQQQVEGCGFKGMSLMMLSAQGKGFGGCWVQNIFCFDVFEVV